MSKATIATTLAVLTAVAGLVATTGNAGSGAHGRSLCGSARWAIKTLKDRPDLLPVRTVTLRYLVSRPAPHVLPAARLRFERHVFRVTATVMLFRHEDDGDIHVVLRDHGLHMITEAPSPSCVRGAKLRQEVQMLNARRAVERCKRPEGAPAVRAHATGVAFFDFKHGQTGVAPNAIELHPLLAFRCLG